MRKPVLLIWTNAAILIVLFAFMTQSLFLVSRVAHTRWARGGVQVRRSNGGVWAPISKGTPVKAGDVLSTGTDGRAEFAWADGTRWIVEPNTTLRVLRAGRASWRGGEQTQFRLEQGKMWVRVAKALDAGSGFSVETPDARATVRGTVWSIETGRGKTRVGVWRGFVDVSAPSGGPSKRISPGTDALVGAQGVALQSAPPAQDAAFRAQSDLTHPDLDIHAKRIGQWAILSGHTEEGGALFFGCHPVDVSDNGAFLQRLALVRGHNQWTLTARDKHGESSHACRALEFDGRRATAGACR